MKGDTGSVRQRRPKRSGPRGGKVQFDCQDCGITIERWRSKVGDGLCRTCASKRNVQKTVPARRAARKGKMRKCQECSKEFYVTASRIGQKFCSRGCMGAAQRNARAKRICPVCGTTFQVKPSSPKKTCSPPCRNELVRRGKLGTKNPRANDLTEAKARWHASREPACANCGETEGRMPLHHVVYQQHVRQKGGDVYDPRNGLTLCWVCHTQHHGGLDQRLNIEILRPENIEFATELLGEAVDNYWMRYYDVGPRPDWVSESKAAPLSPGGVELEDAPPFASDVHPPLDGQ